MLYNVYIESSFDGHITMEQVFADSMNCAADLVAQHLEDGEIVFIEDNIKPEVHSFFNFPIMGDTEECAD